MCGIFGIINFTNEVNSLTDKIIDGLEKLEYRGYDSSGISVLQNGEIQTLRAEGKLLNLKKKSSEISGKHSVGIGHTRWATHGKADSINAHPHCTEEVAVVHNGIIENFKEIREKLKKQGHKFHSQTDSEVIPHLITNLMKSEHLSPFEATRKAAKQLEGAFAIAVIFKNYDNLLIGGRKGSPLAIGLSENSAFIGSDAIALSGFANKICYLEEGEICQIDKKNEILIYDEHDQKILPKFNPFQLSGAATGKGNFRHFMLKEIFEQPVVLADLLKHLYNEESNLINLPEFNPSQINIIACGTSFYAASIAKYWIEKIAKIPTHIDIASEFRYRDSVLETNSLNIFVSQSGETADTLAALKYVKNQGLKTLALVNAEESSMARIADVTLPILAGPEIGVASTKAFTSQLMNFAFLALKLAVDKEILKIQEFNQHINHLQEIPGRISNVLSSESKIKQIAKILSKSEYVIFTGRGVSSSISFEGALKLKELSYIHAQAIAAGEFKHGPIALVDENLPIIATVPNDELFEKTASNLREISARGGKLIILSDQKGLRALEDVTFESFAISNFNNIFSPILYVTPLQLLAYHTALIKGTDVDQPRNLAKSVTVE